MKKNESVTGDIKFDLAIAKGSHNNLTLPIRHKITTATIVVQISRHRSCCNQ